MHLGPEVAAVLAARGCFVVGFDTKKYLQSFTTAAGTLRVDEVPPDYAAIAAFAAGGSARRPILVGVSEGAGLSVLAAADPSGQRAFAGVLALGLPLLNELGWRWRDSLVYLTHGVPNEPTFSTADLIGRVAPLPLAAIESTHDEFVPPREVERLLADARQPARLWIVDASNHRFSGNVDELDRRLVEAIDWIRRNGPDARAG
jgi:fermentation-respiration switch protein FrsA (DUF1100 family)